MQPLKVVYYRRRVLLAVLARDGKHMDKMRLQKLLFLFAQMKTKPSYHFIPYKYGCYSFQAEQDAKILVNYYGVITETDNNYSLNKENACKNHIALSANDNVELESLFEKYSKLGTMDLVYQVYQQYPYYAINNNYRGDERFKSLKNLINEKRPKPDNDHPVLYTIGYEGRSIEEYINYLIRNNISLLIDVRKNPFSMKYGFSKKQLMHITGECNIQYMHQPLLGVSGKDRKNLVSANDYEQLFFQYRESIPQKTEAIQHICNALREHPRTALTCFEKEKECCHRTIVAEAVEEQSGVTVEHL